MFKGAVGLKVWQFSFALANHQVIFKVANAQVFQPFIALLFSLKQHIYL